MEALSKAAAPFGLGVDNPVVTNEGKAFIAKPVLHAAFGLGVHRKGRGVQLGGVHYEPLDEELALMALETVDDLEGQTEEGTWPHQHFNNAKVFADAMASAV